MRMIGGMSPPERQQQLVQTLLQFEDAQERLFFVQDRVRSRPALGPEYRSDSCRIQGCATKVWLVPSLREGRCWFELDSESQMVRGLASLLVDCYTGSTVEEIASFACSVVADAGLERRITPTRLHGLAQVEAAIKSFAERNR
jgi:cysteine desulfuration protein SufE